ncbi:MAG: MmgE/PrpD family protein [Rhodobacteraceae bacterium]|nr:MmgE/PrpD family protein [Paracoccaceae bacterium]
MTSPITGFTSRFSLSDAPESTIHILKLSVLDWCAVGLAGQGEPVSETTRAMVNSEGGAAQASVIGQPTKLPARAAALANGTISHALDYDDTHFLHIAHPSVAIFPAALALAEKENASGAEFLVAALVGYEASCRIGHWLGRSHYDAGFHMTATAGCFGAALAGCRILNLTTEQTADALGIATTRASGLKNQFGTMGKPFNAGMAAANGVEAALLAAGGFVSNPDGLEEFADTHAGARTELSDVLAGLGKEFVLERTQHKFHACCHGLHAALEALGGFLDAEVFGVDQIDQVIIHTHPRWLAVCNKPEPRTGLEAKFSYRMAAAMCLAGLQTGALEDYSEATCTDPNLVRLRNRIFVEPDANLPDSASRISVRNKLGFNYQAAHDLNQRVSPKQRRKRVRQKAAALLGENRAEAIWLVICSLESVDSVTGLAGQLSESS